MVNAKDWIFKWRFTICEGNKIGSNKSAGAYEGGGTVTPAPPYECPPWRGGTMRGLFLYYIYLHFPSSGNLHITLHYIAIVYLNKVKKGINIFAKKRFF